jgi:hypothetical protein
VGKIRSRLLIAVVASALVAGCGILPRVAQQTTAAAIAPVASTARVVSRSLEATSRNLAASSLAAQRTSRQVAMKTSQAKSAARAASQRRKEAERLTKRNQKITEHLAESEVKPEPFDVLAPAVLAQLSVDQAALQRAAQQEAFDAPVGETIFWEDSGRTGTAMAEDEKPMGSFVCRTFLQTVRLDVNEESGRLLACKSPDGVWESAARRAEFVP